MPHVACFATAYLRTVLGITWSWASGVGVLIESRGSGGDAVYTRVEQLIEAGANRAAGREAGTSLAPENEPPLASAQDMIRQVSPESCSMPAAQFHFHNI